MDRTADLTRISSAGYRLADLIVQGSHALAELRQGARRLSYKEWERQFVQNTKLVQPTPSPAETEWVWQSLASDHALADLFLGSIGPITPAEPKRWVRALPAGSTLGIFLKGLKALGAPVLPIAGNVSPDATAVIKADLYFCEGKRKRLGCDEVRTEVRIPVKDAGTAEAEGLLMKIPSEAIAIRDSVVIAQADSLNHALSVVIRRLCRRRRSDTGRIYDYLAWRRPDGRTYLPLETIRKAAEGGAWTFPND